MYQTPPIIRTPSGRERRVGVEVELAGLSVREVAALAAEVLGGTCSEDDATQMEVGDTRFGSFRVELDASNIKERTFLEPLEALGIHDPALLQRVENLVVSIAEELVPVEIVTPPIPVTELGALDGLWEALHRAGGLGTGASMRYAFGLHLNPELPEPMDAATILRHMQAYFLLEDWIVDEERVDWTRRLVPFIDPFPEQYRRMILRPDYAPDLSEFIDDYLRFSPTRNRVMDLLPLFKHLRPEQLARHEFEGADLVGARPTFHYRLPNCEIESEGWTPARAWNRWVIVERLAQDPRRLREMAAAYRSLWDLPWRLQRHGWVRSVEEDWV